MDPNQGFAPTRSVWLAQLDVDVRLLAQLGDPGIRQLGQLLLLQLVRELRLHLVVALELRALHVRHLEDVKAAVGLDRPFYAALVEPEPALPARLARIELAP